MESSLKKKNNFSKDIKKDISHNLQEKVLDQAGNELNTIRRSEIKAEKTYRQSTDEATQGALVLKELSSKYDDKVDILLMDLLKSEEQANLPTVKEKVDVKKLQTVPADGIRNISTASLTAGKSFGGHFVFGRSFENHRVALLTRLNCSELALVSCHSGKRLFIERLLTEKDGLILQKCLPKYEPSEKNDLILLRNLDNIHCESNTVQHSNDYNRRNLILKDIVHVLAHIKDKGSIPVQVALEDKSLPGCLLSFKKPLKVEEMVAMLNMERDDDEAAAPSRREKLRRIRRRMRKRAEDKRLAFGGHSSDDD